MVGCFAMELLIWMFLLFEKENITGYTNWNDFLFSRCHVTLEGSVVNLTIFPE
jgi:hypothetical protein